MNSSTMRSEPSVARENANATSPRRRARLSAGDLALVIGATGLVGATLWWLFRAKTKVGRDEWFLQPNPAAWPFGAWLLPLFLLVLLGGLAGLSAYDRFKRAKSEREARASARLCVGALSLLSLLWAFALQGPGTPAAFGVPERSGAFNVVATYWSDVSNGYFGASYDIENVREWTRTYADRQQTPPARSLAHVATHPPGATLLFYGARRVYESAPFLQSATQLLTGSLSPSSDAPNAAPNADPTRVALEQLRQERRAAVRSALGERAFAPRELPPSALGAAIWCAFLAACGVALTTPAVFLLASRDNDGSRDDGRGFLACALWVLCPSALLWAFSLDVVIAFFVAWSLWAWSRKLDGGQPAWAVLAGALWALGTWISFGALSVAAIFAFASLLKRGARSWRALAGDALGLSAGFLLAWAILLLLFPTPILRVFAQAMAVHGDATLVVRARGPWTLLNFPFFWAFAGWPLVLLVGAELLPRLRTRRLEARNGVTSERADVINVTASEAAAATFKDDARRDAQSVRTWRAGEALGAAALLTTVVLSLSGNVRGEVERLWVFLLPALCVLAASQLRKRAPWAMAALLALGALQTLSYAAAVAPLTRPY